MHLLSIFSVEEFQEYSAQIPVKEPYTDHFRLYAVEFADNSVKIGITKKIRDRIRVLCITRKSNGLDNNLRTVIFTEPHLNARENERIVLSALKHRRCYGETISASQEEIISAINSLEIRLETEAEKILRRQRGDRIVEGLKEIVLGKQDTEDSLFGTDIKTIHAALDLVELAEQLYGPEAARELWETSGALPRVNE